MGLIDKLLGRKPKITTWDEVADALDQYGAFVVNRMMYEYSRARAGTMSAALFSEKEFQSVIEVSRWRAFPLGVGHAAEILMGHLRRAAGPDAGALCDKVRAAAEQVMTRYPTPEGFEDGFWTQAREDIGTRLARAAVVPVKPAQDVAIATFPTLFELVPLHETVRQHDYEVILNSLRGMLLNVADELKARVDTVALSRAAV
jgi:hypothetical protein